MMPIPFWKKLLKVLLAAIVGLSYGAIIGGVIAYLTVNVVRYGVSEQPPQASNLLEAFTNFFAVLGNAMLLALMPLIGAFYGAISSALIVVTSLLVNRGRNVSLLIGAIGATILCALAFLNSPPGDPARLCSLIGLPFLTIAGWLICTMLAPLFARTADEAAASSAAPPHHL